MVRRHGQDCQLPRAPAHYAAFGSQTLSIDFSTLKTVQLYVGYSTSKQAGLRNVCEMFARNLRVLRSNINQKPLIYDFRYSRVLLLVGFYSACQIKGCVVYTVVAIHVHV